MNFKYRNNQFFKAVIAGMAIAFGYMLYGGSGIVNTFAIGIMVVYLAGLPLFTTFLPNLLADNEQFTPFHFAQCCVVLGGNIVGGMLMTHLCRISNYDLTYFVTLAAAKGSAY